MNRSAVLLLAGVLSAFGVPNTYAQDLPDDIAAQVQSALAGGDEGLIGLLLTRYPALAPAIVAKALSAAPNSQTAALAAYLVSVAPIELKAVVAVAAVQAAPSALKAAVAAAAVGAVPTGQQTALAIEVVKAVSAADAAAVTGSVAGVVPESGVASVVEAAVEANVGARTDIEAEVSVVAQDRGFTPDTVTQIANAAATGSGETPNTQTGALDQGPAPDPAGSPG